ncbi:hypothetical protein G9A89_014421 [Geosiphon pyriformis]|nr:hypothetical protein G9A89_014421 [Geosiphon pyriformis]
MASKTGAVTGEKRKFQEVIELEESFVDETPSRKVVLRENQQQQQQEETDQYDKQEQKELEEEVDQVSSDGERSIDHVGDQEIDQPVKNSAHKRKVLKGKQKKQNKHDVSDSISATSSIAAVDTPAAEENTENFEEDPESGLGDSNEDISMPEGEDIYTVEAICDHRAKRGVLEYLIKWEGFPEDQNTWEKRDNLFCESLIQQYWDQKEQDVNDKERWRKLPEKTKALMTPRRNQSTTPTSATSRKSPRSTKSEIRSKYKASTSKRSHKLRSNESQAKSRNYRKSLTPDRDSATTNDHEDDDEGSSKSVDDQPSKISDKRKSVTPDRNGVPDDSSSLIESYQSGMDEHPVKRRQLRKSVSPPRNGITDDTSNTFISSASTAQLKHSDKTSTDSDTLGERFNPAEISGSWEGLIKEVQTVQVNDQGTLVLYLLWNNGRTTCHPNKLVNVKCPQKVLLRFF